MPKHPAREEAVAERVIEAEESTLLDLLDRLVDTGVIATGDLTLGVAGVDLIYVRLSALICGADRVLQTPPERYQRRRRRRPARRRGAS